MQLFSPRPRRPVTVVAIDGTSTHTKAYLALLEQQCALVGAEQALFLSSDPRAKGASTTVVVRSIPPLTRLEYSRFCVERLAELVDAELALFVQLDGFVINPHRWRKEFLDYDFIGAPWRSFPDRPLPAPAWVGNGGFSLRSRRYLRAAATLRWHADWQGVPVARDAWGNEDYFCNVMCRAELEAQGVRFAPVALARHFSLQLGDRLDARHGLGSVFGFHDKTCVRSAVERLARHSRRRMLVPLPGVRRKWRRVLASLPAITSPPEGSPAPQ